MARKHQVREVDHVWMLSAHVRIAAIAAIAALAAACRSQPSPSPAPTSSAPAPPASSPAAAEAAPPVAEGGTALSAPSFAAFEGPETDHRTFRHVLVGALIHPPIRLTWILHRKPDQARLQVLCQLGVPSAQLGMSLTGKENDESIWAPVVETSYVGARTGEIYALTAVPDATGTATCEKLPEALKLTCKTEQVAVLPAGAALVPGTKRNDDGGASL